MANFVASAEFDINAIDLNWYNTFMVASSLNNDYYFTVNSITYVDSFGIYANDGFDDRELWFLGSDINEDVFGNITSGTVSFIGEYDWVAGNLFWSGEGISVSAAALYNAVLTPSNADELALIQTAFSGNDTITLSAFADRMSGYAGHDTLTGGLGADILTGGGGNDTFLDTKAGLSADTITDFAIGDKIVLTDATLAGFTFDLSGSTLTYTGGSLILTGGVSGTLVASAASGGGVQLTLQASAIADVRNDYNGDGRSDILWRNGSGQLSNWLAATTGGFTVNDANAFASIPIEWQVVGTGDFNGDGRADILWRNVNGQLSNWLGTSSGGYVINDANAFANVPTNWHVEGTGDFNGDGRDDILWRNDHGQLSNWLGTSSGGYVINDANAFANVPTSWHVAGTGDFDGDGRDDILWLSDSGYMSNWLGTANGGYLINDANALFDAASWNLQDPIGIGDFNGDGLDDVLFLQFSDELHIMDTEPGGGFWPAFNVGFVQDIPASWEVSAIGDYNGDGRDDMLWRQDDGSFVSLLSSGMPGGYHGFTNDPAAAREIEPHWQIVDYWI